MTYKDITLKNKLIVSRLIPGMINDTEMVNWAFDNFYTLAFHFYFAELYCLCCPGGGMRYPAIRAGELASIFELEIFGDDYLLGIYPDYLEFFPRILEVQKMELFLKQLNGFRGALANTEPLIVEIAQQYFRHVIIPLVLFTVERCNLASKHGIILFVPNFTEISDAGRKAERNKDYPNRDQVIKNYELELEKFGLAEFFFYFFTDFYAETLQLFQVKYKELYDKFLVDFRIAEKFPEEVLNSFIKPPLTLYQLENFISLLTFHRHTHLYGFTNYSFQRSAWEMLSSFYYMFNSRVPVYDYLKFHYFNEIFSKLYQIKTNIVLFFRPEQDSSLCDFLAICYPEQGSDEHRFIAFDINLHDTSEYEQLIRKRDFTDNIFLTKLKNYKISEFVVVNVKGVEITIDIKKIS